MSTSARANPLGVHARTLSKDWTEEGTASAVRIAAEAGFDLIEVPSPAPGEVSAARTRSLVEAAGLSMTVSLALRSEEDISSSDADRVRRGEAALLAAVRFAAAAGAQYVGGVTFSKMARFDRLPTAEGRDSSLRVLRKVATEAAADGVELGVEYVNRYESNLLNTAEQTVQFLAELDAPNTGLHLDTYHSSSEDPSLPAAVAAAGDRLRCIHAAESHRGVLGSGSLDWVGLFDALLLHAYAGPITFESFSPAVVSGAMAVDAALWRTQWTDAPAVAADANRFLADHLARAAARTSSFHDLPIGAS